MNKIKQISIFINFICLITINISNSHANQNFLERNPIYKKTLKNGLTIIIRPMHDMPRVAIQLWYNVGSKDEKSYERGKAHMLEHMVLKGTQKISESDIGMITQKLSGLCNASTSYDYTKFIFNFPTNHWHYALDILSDCMTNCTFKDDLIHSELRAVIQELKGNRDNYARALLMKMIATIFEDHPYHYPIIGYKQDLLTMNSQSLKSFYHKHYIPNNAVLIIVGDVDPNNAFEKVKQAFGNIKPNLNYRKDNYYFNKDIVQQRVTLHRDIQLPQVQISYIVPGSKEKQEYAIEALISILTEGTSSRLHYLLADKYKLVANMSGFNLSLTDHGLLFITFTPFDLKSIDRIYEIIDQEIKNIVQNGFTKHELEKLKINLRKSYLAMLESYDAQADQIGKYYLATGDEKYIYNGFEEIENIESKAKQVAKNYLRPSLKHIGTLLPFDQTEKEHFLKIQEESDKEDENILATRIRLSPVELGSLVHEIKAQLPTDIKVPEPHKFILQNGTTIYALKRDTLPKVELHFCLKANGTCYDPENKEGLYKFMTTMLLEGTAKKSKIEIDEFCRLHGISLSISPNGFHISVLKEELQSAMEIIIEILTQSYFDNKNIEKIRKQIMSNLEQEKENQSIIASKIIVNELYKDHLYSRPAWGNEKSIRSITQKDLINFYKKIVTGHEAVLSIVGDFELDQIKNMLDKSFGLLPKHAIEEIEYKKLEPTEKKDIDHFLNRDQILLAYAGLSVKRMDPEYDLLLLFETILSHGLGSKLFQLRMKTGLYYFISGNMLINSSKERGYTLISALVSYKNLDQAKKNLEKLIDNVRESITEEELHQAKQLLIYSWTSMLASYGDLSKMYVLAHMYNLSPNYLEERIKKIKSITLEEFKEIIRTRFTRKEMLFVKVGRL